MSIAPNCQALELSFLLEKKENLCHQLFVEFAVSLSTGAITSQAMTRKDSLITNAENAVLFGSNY